MPDDKTPKIESPVRVTADATKSLEKATDTAASFIERVVMPPAEALAGLAVDLIDCIRGPFRVRRLENLAKVSQRVAQLREEQEVTEPIPLPPKSTHIVIEQASFEEDDRMRELWAQMIVNAQAGMEISAYMFEVLSKLSGADADLLRKAREQSSQLHWQENCSRLVGQGLVESTHDYKVTVSSSEDELGNLSGSVDPEFAGYVLTSLGEDLLVAVGLPPRPWSGNDAEMREL